jgi:hypothetical protein
MHCGFKSIDKGPYTRPLQKCSYGSGLVNSHSIPPQRSTRSSTNHVAMAAIALHGNSTKRTPSLSKKVNTVVHMKSKDKIRAHGVAWVLLAIAVWMTCSCALAVDCDALNHAAQTSGALVPGSQAVMVSIGTGRIQFYSAPHEGCPSKGIFILPGEDVTAYTEFGDFLYVAYVNSKDHHRAEGWVKTTRLKWTGYGISPN